MFVLKFVGAAITRLVLNTAYKGILKMNNSAKVGSNPFDIFVIGARKGFNIAINNRCRID